MFTYEYTCEDCFCQFEITLHKMKTGMEVVICPSCKSKNVARMFRPLGVHYHAKGFVSHPNEHTEI